MALIFNSNETYDSVLSYKKLNSYMFANNITEEKVFKIIDEISAKYSATTVNNLKRFLDLSFAKLYRGVTLQAESGVDVLDLARKTNLVLVPNHQSYADFMAIGYAFYTQLNLPLYIAAGKNLDFFPMGPIFRSTGAFFIRRSFRGDDLYKLTLEGYLQHLMRKGRTLKFYFEGGRSRTGKLLPPRFGLFRMIIDAHETLEDKKPLCFLPVSISHEFVPEAKAHERELLGEKKSGESATQLLKVVKLLNQRFGTIHVRVGAPVYPSKDPDKKIVAQRLAFDCFRAVGRGMMVTPKSLLSLVLLDHVTGMQTWESIVARCKTIIEYCRGAEIAMADSLQGDDIESPLRTALNLLKNNKRIQIVEQKKLGKRLYSVPDQHRNELLYLKNSILHHFLIPLFINSSWIQVFKGNVTSVKDLRVHFLKQRRLLRYEFYLPETEQMFDEIRQTIASILDRPDFKFAEAFSLNSTEMFKVGTAMGVFTSAFSYIYEGHYLAALALKHHGQDKFEFNDFQETCKEIFEVEKHHGRMIRYPESFSIPLMKSALDYFVGSNVVGQVDDLYQVRSEVDIDDIIEDFVQTLSDTLALNVKLIKDTVG
jgi:glycerol-3-phosphate O-acyltransferase